MSTARRRPLGHGPQHHDTTTADTSREPQAHMHAVDADIEMTPMLCAASLAAAHSPSGL
ncbi:hypothetical protein ACFXPZ_17915 [Streptomyces sp. NPDC059101]|uniref:hypothetical protein n=1 Tax=Streptomyces sp. NPDC059101 TaxID=3346728 RepID=UPI003685E8D2